MPASIVQKVSRVRTVSVTVAIVAAWGAVTTASGEVTRRVDSEGVIHIEGSSAPKKATRSKRSRPARQVMPRPWTAERFGRYDEIIREAAELYRIPVALIRAVVKSESNFDPRAVSHVGAQGLMQLMPFTAERMMVADSFDPRQNIFGGTRYLRILANTFNGNLQLTIAGYNAGEGAVIRYGGIPPYPETQGYVESVLRNYQRYRALE